MSVPLLVSTPCYNILRVGGNKKQFVSNISNCTLPLNCLALFRVNSPSPPNSVLDLTLKLDVFGQNIDPEGLTNEV